jgi:hypothetical protein
MTRDTVLIETPASRATSLMVARPLGGRLFRVAFITLQIQMQSKRVLWPRPLFAFVTGSDNNSK